MTEQLQPESTPHTPMPPATLAHRIGDIILEKKGQDLVVLDIEKVTSLGDYLVLATGSNRRQVMMMAKEIQAEMKSAGKLTLGHEGMEQGWWVLLDFGEVIVHLMQQEAREFYDLEVLWADGEVIRRSPAVA